MENYTGVIIMSVILCFGIVLSLGKYFYKKDLKSKKDTHKK